MVSMATAIAATECRGILSGMNGVSEVAEVRRDGIMNARKKTIATTEPAPVPVQPEGYFEKFKRHRPVAIALIIGSFVIGIGSFFGAVNKIIEFGDRFLDPKPVSVDALQHSVVTTATELKTSFDSVTVGHMPPIPDGDFDRVNRLIKKIEQLDPGNGHVIYYRAFILRWRDQRPSSHTGMFRYLEQMKDTSLLWTGDNGDAKVCFENWHGYCKQRQAFINHFLAIDFQRAAHEEKSPAIALSRLREALERANTAVEIIGGFNDPAQGEPTKVLVLSLKKQIAEAERNLATPPQNTN